MNTQNPAMPQNPPSDQPSATAEVAALRIFVVEHDPMARFGLRAIFAQEYPAWQVCGEADHARQALPRCLSVSPDLVLVDPEIEGGGCTFLRQMNQLMPQVPCVARLRRAHADVVLAAHAEGVRSFVCLSDSLRDLCEAIGQASRGHDFMTLAIRAAVLPGGLSQRAQPDEKVRLTRREQEVYDAVGRGRTVRQIAEDLGIDRKTVYSMCATIKTKLGLRSMEALRHRAALRVV